jgi:protein TonB
MRFGRLLLIATILRCRNAQGGSTVVIRQPIPFSFGFEAGRRPSRLTVAVVLSIGAHVAIGLYVAMMKFTGPPPAVLDEPPIIHGPWIVEQPKPRPPEARRPERPAPPIRDARPAPDSFVPPVPLPPVTETVTSPVGPVTLSDPMTAPEPPRPRDPVIRNPTWVKRPDAGDFARFYPERAARLNRQGEAEITCAVTAGGQLRDCRVTGESPQNLGFGEAALKLARYLQIAPKTVDGQPVDGGVLIVPISFRLPG